MNSKCTLNIKIYIFGAGFETKIVSQEAGYEVDEISEYEKLRNERVSFNRKRMLELFPDTDFAPLILNTKRQQLQAPVHNCIDNEVKKLDPFQIPLPTHEQIYGKPLSRHTSKNEVYGRAYLRRFFPHQWKIYNMNMSCFRSWMKDERIALFLKGNMHHEKSIVEAVKRYLNLRAPELASLTFTEGGTIVTHNMGIDSLYQKFKEYKHDHNKHEN